MRTSTLVIAVSAIAVLALPERAFAQRDLSLRGYAVVGSTWLTARDSFDAVAGSHQTLNIGGGATVTIWKGAFVDLGIYRVKVEGERVFVDQGTVYRLDIPLQITLIPFDLAAGWRRAGRVSAYAAAGVSRISYSERADFAAAGEDIDASGTGPLVFAGADVSLTRLVHVGGEIRYRSVDGPLGQTGVSEIFDEQSIGGFAVSLRVSFGR